MGAALTTVGALVAFQALAIVGAQVALASTCTFNPATGAISITIDTGEFVGVTVETTADNLDAESAAGAILVDLDGLGYENGAASTQCGSATNTNTTSIVVLGQPSGDENFNICEDCTSATFNTAIVWSIDLGGGTGDEVTVDLNEDVATNTIVVTNTTFNLNGGLGTVLGLEFWDIDGGDADDTIDASAVTIDTDRLHGHDGDDVIMPGTNNDGDVEGNAGVDTLSYATRTTSVDVDNDVDAGLDLNADGDNDDAGEEIDDIDCFEIVITGSGNDHHNDLACGDSAYQAGAGNDDVVGDDDDTVSWADATAAVTIDAKLGTATGHGTDTFTGPENFVGGSGGNTLIFDSASVESFVGGAGVDVVDASAKTTGQTINLDTLDDGVFPLGPFTADSLENAIGGSSNDTLTGNDLRNVLTGNDGDDGLFGAAGNDTLFGLGGNDTFDGGLGADTVNFSLSPAGVDADLLLGFATGEGDDAIVAGTIEIVVGSSFADIITGGGGFVATNFRFLGRGGADILTGSGSNDFLKGGPGKDIVRGSGGDDSLFGNTGNDRLFGGGGTDVGRGGKGKDVCKGVEIKSSCGTPQNPRAPVAARLV